MPNDAIYQAKAKSKFKLTHYLHFRELADGSDGL